MRRPWELAHMQQTRGAPRVYVPFTLPDTSAATFAVLELVGFSSSPSSSQSSLSPSLSAPLQPATLCHSQLHLSPIQSFPAPNSASHTQTSAKILTDTSISNHTTTCLKISPVPTMQGVDAAPSSSPPIAKKPVVQTHIKENVVHTTFLNFKDVVQQLTGASSNDKDIMPSSVHPNKLAATPPIPGGKSTANKILDALSVKVDASKSFKKLAPSKLQERRKALYNLEKLCTDNRLALSATSTSPLSPSPVTPLASFFENFDTAITSTASQSSGRSSGISSPEASFPKSDSSNTPLIVTSEHCTSEGCANALSKLQQYASLMESLRGPALLSLFPESPL